MRRDAMFQQHVVGIEEDDIVAPARSKAIKTGRDLVAVDLPPNDLHGRARGSDLVQHTSAVIRRGIIDNDAFDIGIGLRKNGISRVFQVAA
nr:hypothetical protein [Methylovirgula ligni]